jgi:hypothetical protein
MTLVVPGELEIAPTVTSPIPDHESSHVRSAHRARSEDGSESVRQIRVLHAEAGRAFDPLRVKGFGIGGLDPVDRAGAHAIFWYVRNARQSTVRSGEDLAKLVAAEWVHLGDARRCRPTF